MTRTVKLRVLSLCALAAITIASALVARNVLTKPEYTIGAYLSSRGISYRSSSLQEKVLKVELLSKAEDTCTVEDIKAMHIVYSAANGIFKNDVDDLNVSVYGTTNKELSDLSLIGAGGKTINEFPAADSPLDQEQISRDLAQLQEMSPFILDKISVTDATGIAGKRLDIFLKASDPSIEFDKLETLYKSVESYSFHSGAATQGSITLTDENGDTLYYLTGDFLYDRLFSWISPQA